MTKNQFNGTATQPQRNRKFCQFNKDQYCTWKDGIRKKGLIDAEGSTFLVRKSCRIGLAPFTHVIHKKFECLCYN